MTLHLKSPRLWASDDDAVPLHIRCLAGCCWVTQAGHPRDVILQAGQAFRTSPRGKVVIQPLDEATLAIRKEAGAASNWNPKKYPCPQITQIPQI